MTLPRARARWTRLGAIVAATTAIFACAREGPLAPGHADAALFSKIDGAALNAVKLRQIRERGQVCVISTKLGSLDAFQRLTLPAADVPLALPALVVVKTGPAAPARIAKGKLKVKGKVGGKDYGQLRLTCVVPTGFSQAAFLQAIADSATSTRWTAIVARLSLTKPVSRATLDSRKSLEGREVQFELLGTVSAVPGVGLSANTGGFTLLPMKPSNQETGQCGAELRSSSAILEAAPQTGGQRAFGALAPLGSSLCALDVVYVMVEAEEMDWAMWVCSWHERCTGSETWQVEYDEDDGWVFTVPQQSGGGPTEETINPNEPFLKCLPTDTPTTRGSKCLAKLTTTDKARLDSTKAQFRDTSTMADTATKRQCIAIMKMVDSAMLWSRFDTLLYRGGYNTPEVPPFTHEGAAISGVAHIDPWVLNDSSVAKLAEVAFHELIHILGDSTREGRFEHYAADTLPLLPSGRRDYSQDPYFRTLYASDSTKRCLKVRP